MYCFLLLNNQGYTYKCRSVKEKIVNNIHTNRWQYLSSAYCFFSDDVTFIETYDLNADTLNWSHYER